MSKLTILIFAVVIFVAGMFLGVKINDANVSTFVEVDFGDTGGFTIGKQLDLTQISNFHPSDKALLISGLKNLVANDVIAREIFELEKTGQGMFLPREFNFMVHITENPYLDKGIAAFCDTKEEYFYRKTISIFDNREGSITKSMIRVGAWAPYSSAHCLDNDVNHVWISPETAKNLFPSETDNMVSGKNLSLLGRVSNSCDLQKK